jgi:hypothetical protein
MADKTIVQKLFIRPNSHFLLVNPPPGYIERMGELPDNTHLMSEPSHPVDAIQVFVANRVELEAQLPKLKEVLKPGGALWITYTKGTSRQKTDINRDTINAYAQTLGLQGVAMIAIDEDWSALRLRQM